VPAKKKAGVLLICLSTKKGGGLAERFWSFIPSLFSWFSSKAIIVIVFNSQITSSDAILEYV
jgi:hypothetical protein